MPGLAELCAWAEPRRIELLLELKQPVAAPRDDGLVAACLKAVDVAGLLERTTFISFDGSSIAQLLGFEPTASASVLYGRTAPSGWPAGIAGLHLHHRWVTADRCASAHEDGLYVHAWGLGDPIDPALLEALVAAGIDSVSADDPRQLVALLR